MPDLEIIDAHVHTYPSREIGLRAKGDAAGDRNSHGGTIEELEAAMAAGAIRRSVMLCLQPYADMRDAARAKLPPALGQAERARAEEEIETMLLGRQQRRNQWTCEMARQRPALIAFLALDPSMPADALCREIEVRVKDEGARGIKLHTALNKFYPYDPRLFPAYDVAQQRGLPIVYHGGSFFAGRGEYSRPRNFKDVARRFPRLAFVLAHLGQGYAEEALEIAQAYPQVAFDCSAIVSGAGQPESPSRDELARLMRALGLHRVQFGSDYPYFDPVRAVAAFLALPLAADEQRLVLADNARRTLRIP